MKIFTFDRKILRIMQGNRDQEDPAQRCGVVLDCLHAQSCEFNPQHHIKLSVVSHYNLSLAEVEVEEKYIKVITIHTVNSRPNCILKKKVNKIEGVIK